MNYQTVQTKESSEWRVYERHDSNLCRNTRNLVDESAGCLVVEISILGFGSHIILAQWKRRTNDTKGFKTGSC